MTVYVILGNAAGANISLATGLGGTNGFRIVGSDNRFGSALGRAGDINGDGFDDFIIGADQALPASGSDGAG